MRHFASRLRISHRIYLLVGLMTVGCCFLLAFAAYHIANSMFEQRGEQTRRLVESAHSMVMAYAQLVKAGKMATADAQREALERLSSMHYDNDEYFWVNDLSGVVLAHPKRNIVNSNMI